MVSLNLESIFVGDVAQDNWGTIVSGVPNLSLDFVHWLLALWDLFQMSNFFLRNSICGFKSVEEKYECEYEEDTFFRKLPYPNLYDPSTCATSFSCLKIAIGSCCLYWTCPAGRAAATAKKAAAMILKNNALKNSCEGKYSESRWIFWVRVSCSIYVDSWNYIISNISILVGMNFRDEYWKVRMINRFISVT